MTKEHEKITPDRYFIAALDPILIPDVIVLGFYSDKVIKYVMKSRIMDKDNFLSGLLVKNHGGWTGGCAISKSAAVGLAQYLNYPYSKNVYGIYRGIHHYFKPNSSLVPFRAEQQGFYTRIEAI